MIKVILTGFVENFGSPGDCVLVRRGYARNYLFPLGLALPTTDANMARLDKIKKEAELKDKERRDWASGICSAIDGISVDIVMNSTTEGKLYGSVTQRSISDAIERESGVSVSARSVLLFEPIREVGDYTVSIDLHGDIKASVEVHVRGVSQE